MIESMSSQQKNNQSYFFDLGLVHDKQNVPICMNLKTKVRNSLAEQYFCALDTLQKIPWILHYEVNMSQCVEELINTYILIDRIMSLTK